jgi:hypothetical protein
VSEMADSTRRGLCAGLTQSCAGRPYDKLIRARAHQRVGELEQHHRQPDVSHARSAGDDGDTSFGESARCIRAAARRWVGHSRESGRRRLSEIDDGADRGEVVRWRRARRRGSKLSALAH